MGTAAAVVGLLSSVESHRQQKKSRKAEDEAREVQGKKDSLENARQRRRSLVEARRARAQTVAAGAAGGVGGSSAVRGAAGSIQTTGAGNVSFLQQVEGLNQARLGHLNDAASFQSKAATAQAVGNLPAQLGFETDVSSFFNADEKG